MNQYMCELWSWSDSTNSINMHSGFLLSGMCVKGLGALIGNITKVQRERNQCNDVWTHYAIAIDKQL